MNIIQSILKFAENNNGTITAADVRKMVMQGMKLSLAERPVPSYRTTFVIAP